MGEVGARVIAVDFSDPGHLLTQSDRQELLDPVRWAPALEQFARSMNVAVVLTDLQGHWLDAPHNLKSFWSLIHNSQPKRPVQYGFALDPGAVNDAWKEALETGCVTFAQDVSGQVQVIVPLSLGAERLGVLVAGQVFDQFPEQLAVERVGRQFGVPLAQLWEAARSQPPMATATLRVFGQLLLSLGQALLEAGYGVIQERYRASEMSALNQRLEERKRMEQALRDSEANLRLALQASGAVTWRWQPGVETQEWSPEYRELYGFRLDEPPTLEKWKARVHPADIDPLLARLRKAFESTSDTHWREEFRILHPERGVRWLSALGRIVRDSSGRAVQMAGINFDVTSRKLAEEDLRDRSDRLELLSETLAQLLQGTGPATIAAGLFQRVAAHLDVDTFFTYEAVTEAGEAEIRRWSDGVSEKHQAARKALEDVIGGMVAQTRQSVYATEMQRAEFLHPELVRELGINCYYCSPLLVGDRFLGTLSFASRRRSHFDDDDLRFVEIVVQYTAIALDRWRGLAELKRAHELLGDRAKHLESLVRERTTTLQDTIQELEAFSYTVAHDLRAPLRSIEGYAELLLEEATLGAEHTDYLDRMRRSAARLDQLTRDVLNYSRIARAEVDLDAIGLDKLVHDVIEQYPNLRAHRTSITFASFLADVVGNEPLLTQVLANLLGNAVKFVREGEVPQVRLKTTTNAGIVTLSIEDRGIGIAAEHQKRLFRIFGRVHPDARYQGTGIGLSIVKRAVEKMAGTVGFESVEGQGSRFWVALPAPRG